MSGTIQKLRIETISKLALKPGELLWVKLGGEIGDGLPAYIPDANEIERAKEEIEDLVPEGVNVLVTHQFYKPSVIANA
jgi:hypothetical protein